MRETGIKKKELIYKMYASGMSMCEIARVLHINKSSLSRRFKRDKRLTELKQKREETKIVGAGDVIKKNKDRIREMLSEKVTLEEIAKMLNITKSALKFWLYKKRILYSKDERM